MIILASFWQKPAWVKLLCVVGFAMFCFCTSVKEFLWCFSCFKQPCRMFFLVFQSLDVLEDALIGNVQDSAVIG